MVQFGYGEKKIFLFGAVGVIPLMSFMLLTLVGFPVMGALVFSVLVLIACIAGGHIFSSQNSWIKAVQSHEPIVIDTNSTGVGASFNIAITNNVFSGGKDIVLPDGTHMAYDRAITHLIASPQKGQMSRVTVMDEKGNPTKYLVTAMPIEEYKNAVWSIDNKTFMFFDSIAGTFLTKPLLGVTEKELMSDYITLNELREIRELSKVMREFTRYTFDLIASKFAQILKNPIVMFIIIAVVLVIVGYGIITMFPDIIPRATAIAQPIAQPLVKGVGA